MVGPPGWRRRFEWLSLAQVGVAIGAPTDTVFRWLQLLHATGQEFGRKHGKPWTFNVHELYVFLLIAAFYRAGIPIGPAQIRAVAAFAYDAAGDPVVPKGRLVQVGPLTEFAIDAVATYEAARFAMNDEVPTCFKS